MSSSRIVAAGSYIPTLPENQMPKRYRIRITESQTVTSGNYADVRIRVLGADPCYFAEQRQVRMVGEWESVAPMTISNSGGGLCFFDGWGTFMLLGEPYYTHPDPSGPQVWDIDDVTGLGSVRRVIAFAVGDYGPATQYATTCSGPTCARGSYTSGPIHPGRCFWQCVPEPTPAGP